MANNEVEIIARALELESVKVYEWTPEQFEVWWLKDPRNTRREQRRDEARAVLAALRAAGYTLLVPAGE